MINNAKKPTALMAQIACNEVFDEAYRWVSRQRRHYPDHADIWVLRRDWLSLKPTIITQLCSNNYQFSANKAIQTKDGKTIHLWSAQDALVLKAIALVIGPRLSISPRCTHHKGHGGLKGALRWLRKKLLRRAKGSQNKVYSYVIRTDVKQYYDNIDHERLMQQLERVIPERDVMRLLTQSIKRTVEWGGLYRDIQRGLGRGSPLSPLYGSLYLKPLDDALDQAGLAFVRYMDDILIISKTRWHNRRAWHYST